jgi:hypothetical protein
MLLDPSGFSVLQGLQGFFCFTLQGLQGFFCLALQGLQGFFCFTLQGLQGFFCFTLQGLQGFFASLPAWAESGAMAQRVKTNTIMDKCLNFFSPN